MPLTNYPVRCTTRDCGREAAGWAMYARTSCPS